MRPLNVKVLLFASFILFIGQGLYAQLPTYRNIASNEGMGNITSTNTNYGAGLSNIAGIAYLDQISLATSYRYVMDLEGFNTASLTASVPIKIGSFALGVNRFGDDLFNQQMVSVGYANTFGITSLGIRTNYLQYSIEAYGSKGIVTLDVGVITKLTDELYIGAHITNINQAKLADFEDERAPTIMALGVSYCPSTRVILSIEVEKDIDLDPVFKSGVEYKVIDKLALRTGINTKPNRQYFGLGFTPHNVPISLDYTLSNNRQLGMAHQVGLAYQIARKP